MEPKADTYAVGGLPSALDYIFASEQAALDYIRDRLTIYPTIGASKIRLYKVIPLQIDVVRTVSVKVKP